MLLPICLIGSSSSSGAWMSQPVQTVEAWMLLLLLLLSNTRRQSTYVQEGEDILNSNMDGEERAHNKKQKISDS